MPLLFIDSDPVAMLFVEAVEVNRDVFLGLSLDRSRILPRITNPKTMPKPSPHFESPLRACDLDRSLCIPDRPVFFVRFRLDFSRFF